MSEDKPTVEYRALQHFPGYRVGNDGSVWSAWKVKRKPTGYGSYSAITDSWRQLKPGISRRKGRPIHCGVVFMVKGVRHNIRVHFLVLETFIGPCPEGLEGCHEDGDPTNNNLTNLRWDTRKSNAADRIRHNRQICGESHHLAELTEEKVRTIRLEHAAGGTNYEHLGRKFGVYATTISAIVKRQTWKHIP